VSFARLGIGRDDLERLLTPYPDVLTAGEVAEVLRVHLRSVQRWAKQGRVATVRVGRSFRIPRAEVLRWMVPATNPLFGVHQDVGAPIELTAALDQEAG
jgi:excisionase family DNA binding protein